MSLQEKCPNGSRKNSRKNKVKKDTKDQPGGSKNESLPVPPQLDFSQSKRMKLNCLQVPNKIAIKSLKDSLKAHFDSDAQVMENVVIAYEENTAYLTVAFLEEKREQVFAKIGQLCSVTGTSINGSPIEATECPLEQNTDDMTFQVRPGIINRGLENEQVFVANLTLEGVVNEEIQDFSISINDNDFGSIDDVVATITTQTCEEVAVQLKYGIQLLEREDLDGTRPGLHLWKHCTNFTNFASQYHHTPILFTNRQCHVPLGQMFPSYQSHLNVQLVPYESHSFLTRCFGEGNTYKIQTENSSEEAPHNIFFDKFCLFTDQWDVDRIKRNCCTRFCQEFHCDENVFLDFLDFFNNWKNIGVNKKKLHKSWIKEVIAICLLKPFVVPYTGPSSSSLDANKLTTFREVIKSFDVTVFGEDLEEKVKQLWDVEGQDLDLTQVGKKYYIQIDPQDVAKDRKIAILLWLKGVVPLVVKDSPSVLKAIKLCSGKKFIVLTDHLQVGTLKVFSNLSDLSGKKYLQQLTTTFSCSIQGKSSITLKEFIGGIHQLEKCLTTDKLILSLFDSLVIGEPLTVPPVQDPLTRHVLSPNFLFTSTPHNLVVISNFNPARSSLHHHFNVVDITTLKQNPTLVGNRSTICVTNQTMGLLEFKELRKKMGHDVKIHQVKMSQEGRIEWVRSSGGTRGLKEHLLSGFTMEAEEFLAREEQLTALYGNLDSVFGAAAMKHRVLSSLWTLVVDPEKHSRHFGESKDLKDFRKYLVEELSKSKMGLFELEVLKVLMRHGRVSYIWNGLDELAKKRLPAVLKIIEAFAKKGVKQCITSRHRMTEELEDRFSILSRTVGDGTSAGMEDKANVEARRKRVQKTAEDFVFVAQKMVEIPLQIVNNVLELSTDVTRMANTLPFGALKRAFIQHLADSLDPPRKN